MVLSLSFAASAPAFIYWTGDGGSFSGAIGRANNSGIGVQGKFLSGHYPEGIAIDGAHIYWANFGSASIARANLDGSAVNQSFIVTSPHRPEGVAVDGGHVYWTNEDNGPGTTIGRANLDGTGVNENFITGLLHPLDVVVDSAYIYWTAGSAIGRANLDGSGVNQTFIPFYDPSSDTYYPSPWYLAVDSTHIYWDNDSTSCGAFAPIARADLDGGNINRKFINFTGTSGCPQGLAVDGAHIYWAGVFDDFHQAVGRANLDGSGVNAAFMTHLDNPYGVAVDGLSGPLGPVGQVALTRLLISPAAFPAAPSGPGVLAARVRYGTRVGYRLTKAATVRFAVARLLPGRRIRGRCVKPTKANHRARRCTRLVTLGRFTLSGRAGLNAFRFSGRLGGRKLAPGNYRLTATPSAGGKTGRAASAAFRIIR